MLPESSNDLSLSALLDVLPEAIAWLKPVYNADNELINLQFVYVNEVIRAQSRITNYAIEPGTFFLDDTEVRPAYFQQHFSLLSQVLQTGVTQTYTQFNELLNGWYTITHRLMDGGVLSVARNVSEEMQAAKALEEQASLTQAMLNGSQAGVLLLQAIYNVQEQIDDFLIIAANKPMGEISNFDPKAIIGQPMERVYPNYRQSEFFRLYCQTFIDGEPRRAEYYYEDAIRKGWFEASINKQGNYLVLTVTKTTETHEFHATVEQAARNLQSVIDHSQTGIFVFSPVFDPLGEQIIDFRFKTINRMVAALVGQTPDGITGQVASDWFISYRETGLFDKYRHTYLTGEPQRFDINYNVDGFDVWFDVQSVRVDNDVLVTFTDYTLLKHAQQTLEQQANQTRKQTELLNSVLDGSESGIMAFEAVRDPELNTIVDFRFVVVNKACESILGLPIEPLVGKSLYEVFPGNWETGLFELYAHTTETGQPGRTEVYYNHDGLDFWLTISAQQLGDGFVVTFSDISALKRANRAVEDAAGELITVVDTSQTGIFLFEPIFDKQGTVTDFRFKLANKQLGTYINKDSREITGKLGSQLFPDYVSNGLFERYRATYLTGQNQRFDFHYDDGGIDAWLDIMVTKMEGGILVTFTDYTALKQLQHQLENTIADLKRTNDNLEQFAYVASHDLQEPLRKIRSFGDVLKGSFGHQLNDEGTGLIDRMQTAANRMSGLIRDLLAYSRLASRKENLEAISLQTVLSRVLDDLDLSILETGAVIHAGPLPTVCGDDFQLRQLLQNLLSNALKFRPEGSSPVVHIQSERVPAATLPADVKPLQQADYYERIELSDNGIGFEQKYVDRIFQVFQRLHGRSKYEGTGIGLAIVQKVVENHGGAIVATSEPGKGATFTIYLPAI
ncbi:PAS domain-containing sensor histidine kinase [Fibrella forsythiae]|uniref:histidine kinase n=1 Tax=Fibrella forsythiae TaxID=2817061 RepID=A0ABS3JIF1_9BACT|nr:ATP-binding protein [Fibrella forsythiae]MBO0949019.1 PAS domain-containing protein [Fibrella forsythiae]